MLTAFKLSKAFSVSLFFFFLLFSISFFICCAIPSASWSITINRDIFVYSTELLDNELLDPFNLSHLDLKGFLEVDILRRDVRRC